MSKTRVIKVFLLHFFVLLSFTPLVLADMKPNKYTLTITDANQHLADVVVEFSGVKTKAFEVKLPVWRSGRYEILDLAKNIRYFSVLDANGKELTWHKKDKNSWKIFVNTPDVVKVKYQIYANQLRDRVSHIDETHAFLDASGVFVYSESQRDKALTVKLNVPSAWKSVSGMDTIGEHQFKANNYDQLVDSPIESGIHHYDSIQVEEQLYEIVIWGKGNYDMLRLKEDIKKLHFQAKAIWKTFPFKRYVYMYHAGDNLRGATEHVNSTILQLDRFGFAPDKKYRKIIGTTAHEFIHTWNVKSYRPAGISPYDYSTENYSDLFWMAEGTTSYFDSLMATRAGIYTVEQYLEYLAKDIHDFKRKPGRKVMSLKESSFDTWFGNDSNRRHNTTVSIYLKGSLVSWLMDKQIREITNNKKSIEDLHYVLFQKYGKDKQGYTSYNVRQLLKEITASDFTGFWSDYVDGTKEINFDELLSFYGLQFEKDETKKNESSIGVKLHNNNGLAQISVVDSNGPAWQAGLTSGDNIIAIDGLQVSMDNFQTHIENLEIGKSYSLHYFSQGILKQTIIKSIKAVFESKIIPIDKASKKQKQRFESWIKHGFKDSFKK